MSVEIPDDALQLDWETIEDMSVDLANSIEASGEHYDALLVLQRGGAFTGNVLARRFNMQADRVLSGSVTSYDTGSSERRKEFQRGQFPLPVEIDGHSILVVDEVCDTGHTLKHVMSLVHGLGALSARSAVLHYKPKRSETGYVPDFYVEETSKWIVYPWEHHEQEGLLSQVAVSDFTAIVD